MFCIKCGKQIIESALYCPFCGTPVSNNSQTTHNATDNKPQPSLIPALDYKNSPYKTNTTSSNSSSGLGTALIIIGCICGILAFLVAVSQGEIFGYSSWDYEYGDARTVNVFIALAAVFSFIMGIFINSSSKK